MSCSKGRRPHRPALGVEPLEGRQLLSIYTGPSAIRPVSTPGGVYQITVTGGGLEKVHQLAPGVFALDLFGTTANSTVSVTLLRPRPHFPQAFLQLGQVVVKSGELGSIQALNTANLIGPISPITGSVNSLQFNELGPNARVNIGGSLGGAIFNSVDLGPSGSLTVAGDLTGPLNVNGPLLLDGGQITVGNDATAPISVNSLTIQHNGLLSIGRDLTGGLSVNGDLTLNSGGNLKVGREFDNPTVTGNVIVLPTGGAISAGGDLMNLTVGGFFQGKGTSQPDLTVGLNLVNPMILGGGAGRGGLQGVNIEVAKSILCLNVAHGIFNSFISAGVSIDQTPSTGTATSCIIGPDGADAIFDSEIRAGVSIIDLLLDGDVVSDWATNPHPTGYPTRIIAGEDRAGNYVSGGHVDNFLITGNLDDSVLAASVAPYGGNGTLPDLSYGAPPPAVGKPPGDSGFNTYDEPAGLYADGTPNYTELTYVNGKPTVAYNPADPTIDDTILPGSMTGTIDGLVISTPHGDNADYAGMFAASVHVVIVGEQTR